MTNAHAAAARTRKGGGLSTHFSKFAQAVAISAGQPASFLLAVAAVVLWGVTGPIFRYSETWQLVINTGTTIVTFLMVFLIQNTQNRDILTLQLKLSELVLAMKGAEDRFASIEDLSDDELEKLHEQCRARAEMTANHLERRRARSATNAAGVGQAAERGSASVAAKRPRKKSTARARP